MEELKMKSMIGEWGKCLKNKNVDIFDVIEKVIKVAATDHPKEFLRRRDEIAHYLYWCEFNEEEKRRVGEVLRIKAILEKHGDCGSVSVVYESLKELHKMGLCFKVVDAAGIGNTVSRLQDHASKQVKQIAEMIIGSWMRRAMFDRWVDSYEKMPALHQEDEQGGELKKNDVILPTENQNVRETRKSLKVRIKVIRVKDESAKNNVLNGPELKIGYKDTGVDEVLTSKGVPEKSSRDEFEPVTRNDLVKKLMSFNPERKNIKVNSEKASVPKGRDEQRVKLINSKGTMEEKLEAARRKLREAKNSEKKRSIQLLQSWEVNTLLPPESQQLKSTNKRFRR
ncbi:Transcription elongation factor, TFIIS/CRSP70 [Artemisia annua]|uniref:Transcription elongation factor, TFIIS/CRSP70 n=1 Tax=Artemisia annua TaxID=35608 RepID=A0A2U1MWF9_ARTAN|nr:Transcription elongation factor, TFIIS/CRSP70 [Artemisia annua]